MFPLDIGTYCKTGALSMLTWATEVYCNREIWNKIICCCLKKKKKKIFTIITQKHIFFRNYKHDIMFKIFQWIKFQFFSFRMFPQLFLMISVYNFTFYAIISQIWRLLSKHFSLSNKNESQNLKNLNRQADILLVNINNDTNKKRSF